MHTALIIPARFASSRYPGKPLVEIRGASSRPKPLIQRCFELAKKVRGPASVHIATDDDRIAELAASFGADVIMTRSDCRNGTERCAEALERLGPVDLVVNLQGDALLTPARMIEALIEQMEENPTTDVATTAIRLRPDAVSKLQAEEAAGRVGGTTVVTDANGRALYFSKRLIPHLPTESLDNEVSPVRMHVGIYAYRPQALRLYADQQPAQLELLEGLEQLRFLVAGVPVKVVEVEPPPYPLIELNNPEDLAPIELALSQAGIE